MVFAAEMGDKTQLVALSLATRFNIRVVLAGILGATLLVHVLSVALGGVMCRLLPGDWIVFVAGLSFIGFGFWTLRGDTLDEDEGKRHRSLTSPFLLVFVTFFLAELGDKTMLTTCVLAAKHPPVPVWLGSSLGMVLADGIAIVIGCVLGKQLPEKPVKYAAATIFFVFGLMGAVTGAKTLPPAAWAGAALALACLAYMMFRKPSPAPDAAGKLTAHPGSGIITSAQDCKGVPTIGHTDRQPEGSEPIPKG